MRIGEWRYIRDLHTRWRWVVSFTHRPLYPREWVPGTHWVGRGVGPIAGVDAVIKRKIPSPCRASNPTTIQPVAKSYTTELSRPLGSYQQCNKHLRFIKGGEFPTVRATANLSRRTLVKVKLFPCLTKHHSMKMFWGVEV